MVKGEHLAGVLATIHQTTVPRVVRGITVHHSDGRAMAQPEEVDRWHEARGFECVVRAEDYAPDTVPLWLHLRPGQAFRLHLGYHVYITADGAVWRARPESKAGAHCKVAGRNISHLGVCLAGKLEEQTPSGAQMEALRDVCSRWCVRYGLDPQTAIEGHRDAPGADTDCPGRYLWELLPRLRADVAEMLPSTSAV